MPFRIKGQNVSRHISLFVELTRVEYGQPSKAEAWVRYLQPHENLAPPFKMEFITTFVCIWSTRKSSHAPILPHHLPHHRTTPGQYPLHIPFTLRDCLDHLLGKHISEAGKRLTLPLQVLVTPLHSFHKLSRIDIGIATLVDIVYDFWRETYWQGGRWGREGWERAGELLSVRLRRKGKSATTSGVHGRATVAYILRTSCCWVSGPR